MVKPPIDYLTGFKPYFQYSSALFLYPPFVNLLQRCAKRVIEHDAPITRYYDRLAAVQQRGSQASHQVLRDLLKDIMTNQVPRTILKEWAMHTFQDATDYWTFRSTVSTQIIRRDSLCPLALTLTLDDRGKQLYMQAEFEKVAYQADFKRHISNFMLPIATLTLARSALLYLWSSCLWVMCPQKYEQKP